uniref:Uncharacterized protein n=1 Tax=Syphacia muris TaxID=451379 RepID=A0A0N5AUV8_9BILA
MRRSASSVSSRPKPEPDVSEHFRRSLSGKWPRRQTNHTHYTPPQNDKDRKNDITIKRHNSSPGYENSRQSPPFCMSPGKKNVIVKDYGIDIEEHFRRALGADKYEMLIKNRNLN